MANKRKRPQSPKSRSVLTKNMILENRSTVIPSGTAYKRPKSGAVDYRYSD